jgi:hypothetical protein
MLELGRTLGQAAPPPEAPVALPVVSVFVVDGTAAGCMRSASGLTVVAVQATPRGR